MNTGAEVKETIYLSSNNTHNLLKQIEGYNKEGAKKFINKLNAFTEASQGSSKTFGSDRTASGQRAKLKDLQKKCDALLPLLQTLTLDQDREFIEKYDRTTKYLINDSYQILKREKHIASSKVFYGSAEYFLRKIEGARKIVRVTMDDFRDRYITNRKAVRIQYENNFLTYPEALIVSLSEFRDAVKHAADHIKVTRGNNTNNYSERINKENLANFFVKTYSECFKEHPLDKYNKLAHQVFFNFLQIMEIEDMSASETALKKAIKSECTDRKEHEQQMKATEQDQTNLK